MADHPSVDDRPLSEILSDLGDAHRDVAISELVERFGSRAFGALIFVFAVVNCLPLPPGSSTVLSIPIILLAPQVALGRRTPWLPEKLRHRTIPADHLRSFSLRLLPTLRRIERVSRPRLSLLFGGLGGRLIGAVCTLLAMVLVLPIPLGNLLPAAAVAALALALVQRDGALALAGYALVAASTAVLIIAARIIIRGAEHLIEVLGLA
jgi:hypothetical protein